MNSLYQRLLSQLQVWQGVPSEFEQTKTEFVAFANGSSAQNKPALVLARADSLLFEQPILPKAESEYIAAFTRHLDYAEPLPKLEIKREIVNLITAKDNNLAKLNIHPVTQYLQAQRVEYISALGGTSVRPDLAVRPEDEMFNNYKELNKLYASQKDGISSIKEIIQ